METRDSIVLHRQAREARARAIGNLVLRAWQAVTGVVTQRHAMPTTFPEREYYPWP